jgi:hypothetical protein
MLPCMVNAAAAPLCAAPAGAQRPPAGAAGAAAAPAAARRSRRRAPGGCGVTASLPPAAGGASASAALRGADFVRPHLRTMAPYTPIVPFDVLSEQLGRAPADIIKLDANENPYGPPPGALPRVAPALSVGRLCRASVARALNAHARHARVPHAQRWHRRSPRSSSRTSTPTQRRAACAPRWRRSAACQRRTSWPVCERV